jgi:hypothetical protein
MPTLNWNEIRLRAARFSAEWAGATSERGDAQSFWDSFFDVFGVARRRVAVFEQQVQKLALAGQNKTGRMDVFWPGYLLGEHKSAGEDLHAAYEQALGYLHGLKPEDQPRYIVVCDFAQFRFYDLEARTECAFFLSEFAAHIHLFGFIAGYQTARIREEDPINERAVQLLGELHDLLKKDGYSGEKLEVFLVRLVFCLFADDTGIFNPKDIFIELLENHTRVDGGDTGALLAKLFEVLATKHEERQKSLDEDLARFPYVNGRLFEKQLPIPDFSSAMRQLLLDCCALNWSAISPAIFGAMFQAIIELDAKDRRRQLGAHYTSEKNILRLIGPLFLDELRAEFERVKHRKNELFTFHKKLRSLTFLDPACGCGNFLVVTYRELRELELDVLLAAQQFGSVARIFEAIQVNVDQFYGIEVEEFPAQIAQVALWLMDHQMNVKAGLAFNDFFNRIPLKASASILRGNALRLDWEKFIPPNRLSYIFGNPPFIGKSYQSAQQKEDLDTVCKGIKGAGVLDYVAGWYLKAAQYLSGHNLGALDRNRADFENVRFGKQDNALSDLFAQADHVDELARSKIRCGFVSTNSITQGEQVGVLWSAMQQQGMQIQFAHRTFKWSNDAPGKAAVHCVIVGFARPAASHGARLFDYADIAGEPLEIAATQINPYLVDAPQVALPNRREPICTVPNMVFGSMPNDGGHLLLSDSEKDALMKIEPQAEKWLRPFLGAEEFINGIARWCLWLKDITPDELSRLPQVAARIAAVKQHRLASTRASTRKLAETPRLFGEDRQPEQAYLLVPRVSSEIRTFIPIGFMPANTIASDASLTVPNATLYHFGILNSTMHNTWMRAVCGRLKSDYRYSASIVYNNFPWPQLPAPTGEGAKAKSKSQIERARDLIEAAAQAILDARASYPTATLAQLYHPNTMPDALHLAHKALDQAVDAAYGLDGGQKKWANEAERVAFLFRRYAALTSLLAS